MVCFFIPGDTGVSRDLVNLGRNAVGEEGLRPSVDPPRYVVAVYPWTGSIIHGHGGTMNGTNKNL
jgi:hypothetical protein